MFSSIGWGEILVIIIVGIIVVGPERLPRLITDIKALILAARNAIANARRELDQDFGDEFEEFRKPLEQLNSVRQMGARGFITKTLLDDDDSFLTDLEKSAKDVTGATQGTTARMSGNRRRVVPAPGESPEELSTGPAAPRDDAETATGTGKGRSYGAGGTDGRADTSRVELPQQDEVGQSRDWSSPDNYDDTL